MNATKLAMAWSKLQRHSESVLELEAVPEPFWSTLPTRAKIDWLVEEHFGVALNDLGFNDNWEPNAIGMQLESLIDQANRVRLAIEDSELLDRQP